MTAPVEIILRVENGTVSVASPAIAQPVPESHEFDVRLLTIEEVGERVGLRPTAVRSRIWSGEIRSVKIGNRVRVPTDALAEWIAGLPSAETPLASSTPPYPYPR